SRCSFILVPRLFITWHQHLGEKRLSAVQAAQAGADRQRTGRQLLWIKIIICEICGLKCGQFMIK
ncbi:MAG: hypothetical protein B1H13_12745, partial [Desulfobacteraceae bacterium 4484_190.3]